MNAEIESPRTWFQPEAPTTHAHTAIENMADCAEIMAREFEKPSDLTPATTGSDEIVSALNALEAVSQVDNEFDNRQWLKNDGIQEAIDQARVVIVRAISVLRSHDRSSTVMWEARNYAAEALGWLIVAELELS